MSLADPNQLLQQAVAELSDDRQLHGLLHECCCNVPLPSAPALAEVIELCRAVLFPGFFGKSEDGGFELLVLSVARRACA